MSLEVIIKSLNLNKRLFIQYGVSNVTEAFLTSVYLYGLNTNDWTMITQDVTARITGLQRLLRE